MNTDIKRAADLRKMYLKFFEGKGHAVIPSASIIPENDPTVLFTTAGMHPLVPYLLGEKHPMGKRLTDVQKCVRTGDIDEVGDSSHLTFFEMLGNWSLGDYFKKEAIAWSWEFLTSPEWLGLDKDKLAFSVFAGDANAPRDEEAASCWKALGVKEENIFYLSAEHNWWGPAGTTGPCGPDTEMFVIKDQPPCSPECSPACNCGRYLEIWNDVFMQYNKQVDGAYLPMEHSNVDTGMGLERTIGVLMGVKSVYDTDLFEGIIAEIERLSGKKYAPDDEYTRAFRIIADHMRTSTFILGDDHGVTPSNVDQGYVLRRLIRRSVRHGMKLELPEGATAEIAKVIVAKYKDAYPELKRNEAHITEQFLLEEARFQKTLKQGMKEFDKLIANITRLKGAVKPIVDALEAGTNLDEFANLCVAARKCLPPRPEYEKFISALDNSIMLGAPHAEFLTGAREFLNMLDVIDGRSAFKLYDTYGFPVEITRELAAEKGLAVDEAGFRERFKQHQETSHAGAEQRFKGGLADNSAETAKLHTATHLMHAALRRVLGEEVAQKGSNITAERLRFDFTFGRKLTPEELDQVEKLVNEYISGAADVVCEEMSVEEAKNAGAIGLFESKYGERVKVYTMGGYSKEICGGPHASNTSELRGFKIQKEESSSAGVRRIKAVIG